MDEEISINSVHTIRVMATGQAQTRLDSLSKVRERLLFGPLLFCAFQNPKKQILQSDSSVLDILTHSPLTMQETETSSDVSAVRSRRFLRSLPKSKIPFGRYYYFRAAGQYIQSNIIINHTTTTSRSSNSKSLSILDISCSHPPKWRVPFVPQSKKSIRRFKTHTFGK